MSFLDEAAKRFSLWSMKTAYRGMNDYDKRQTKIDAYKRVQKWKATGNAEDLKIAEMWQEFYEWICKKGI